MRTEQTSGQVAVITGASSGIGAATARALAGHGYNLALLGRRLDRIEALAAELGDSAIAIAADVTDRESLVTAANRVQAELGGADVLINNAGVMLLAPFSSEQRHELRQMVEVNLLGAMTATEVFLDQLRNGGGDLINISSVAGRTARAGNSGYAATKWGMNGWSEALRQELQPDIRVTRHRTRRCGDRTHRPHHRPGRQTRRRTALPTAGHHRRGRRRGHRLRRHPPPADDAERDPPPTHRANRLIPSSRSVAAAAAHHRRQVA